MKNIYLKKIPWNRRALMEVNLFTETKLVMCYLNTGKPEYEQF